MIRTDSISREIWFTGMALYIVQTKIGRAHV